LYINRKASTPFSIGEMTAFTEFVTSIEDVEVIHGVAYDDTLDSDIKLTILASGFEAEVLVPEKKQNPIAAALNNPGVDAPIKPKDDIEVIKQQYGEQYAANVAAAKARNLYVVLTPDQLDDDNVIEALEAYPAFSRSKEEKAAITASAAGKPGQTGAPNAAGGQGGAAAASSSETIEF
ncbi:MAG: hypothetical protein K2M40_00710, partial [Muribaculaceae bacterium]|nr:hypothetical protein [Muribaculaceae bacterium]